MVVLIRSLSATRTYNLALSSQTFSGDNSARSFSQYVLSFGATRPLRNDTTIDLVLIQFCWGFLDKTSKACSTMPRLSISHVCKFQQRCQGLAPRLLCSRARYFQEQASSSGYFIREDKCLNTHNGRVWCFAVFGFWNRICMRHDTARLISFFLSKRHETELDRQKGDKRMDWTEGPCEDADLFPLWTILVC